MYLKEIWRYPVKSMAGERIEQSEVGPLGIEGDRQILVLGSNGRVLTARTHPKLLGLKGSIGGDGAALISGQAWDSKQARLLVEETLGQKVTLIRHEGPERFDVLPLLVATDGAITYMGFDGRRLRPNLVIGGVEGLEERKWAGRQIEVGETLIEPQQLRGRCVMTTFDPDTLKQDLNVLKSIVKKLDGVMALDTSVLRGGLVREGDLVRLAEVA